MKKFTIAALSLFAAASIANAEGTTVNLWNGNQAVTWENTLKLDAGKFATAAIGDEIVITMAEGAGDVMELKSDGIWIPGSAFCWLEGKTEVKAVITQGMLVYLKNFGLELCGPEFTVTSVDLVPQFMAVPDNAVWAGYQWIDGEWNTLEVYKSAFIQQNPQRLVINFSPEAENSTFILNVLTKWDDNDMKLSSSETLTIKGTQAVLDLTKLPKAFDNYFDGENCLKIQGHVEDGNSFNITSVCVEPYSTVTSVVAPAFGAVEAETVNVYTMSGMLVKKSVSAADAANALPAGLYIIGNKKVVIK